MTGMERNFGVGILLSLKDAFSKNAQKIEHSMRGLDQSAAASAARIEKSMSRIKRGAIMMGVGAGMMAAVALPVKQAAAWEKGVHELWTLLDISKSRMKSVASEILTATTAIGQVPAVSIKAAYNLASAGIETDNLVKTLVLAGKMGVAGVSDINTAAEVGISVMRAYDMEAKQLPMIYSQLFSTIRKGKTTLPELEQSLGQVVTIAKKANIPLHQLLGTLATITLSGTNTSESVTSLKAMLQALVAPSSQAAKELRKVGGYQFQVAAASGDLAQMLTILNPKLKTLASMRDVAPNVRAMMGIASSTGDMKLLLGIIKEIEANLTSMPIAYGKMADTLSQQTDILTTSLDRLNIEGANPLLGGFKPIVWVLTVIVRKMGDFAVAFPFATRLIGGTVGILGALIFTLGAATMGLGLFGLASAKASIQLQAMAASGSWTAKMLLGLNAKLGLSIFSLKYATLCTWLWAKGMFIASGAAIKSFVVSMGLAIASTWAFTAALLANPITWIVAGIIALGVGVYFLIKHFDKVTVFLQGWWSNIKDLWGKYGAEAMAIMVPFIGIPLMIIKHWKTIIGFFNTTWRNITGGIRSFVDTIKGIFIKIGDFFMAPFLKIWAMIQKVIALIPNWALPAQLEAIKTSVLTAGLIGVTAVASPVAPAAVTPVASSSYQVPQIMSTTSRILEREVIRERDLGKEKKTDEQHHELIRKLDEVNKRSLEINSKLYLDSEVVSQTVTKRQVQRTKERAYR